MGNRCEGCGKMCALEFQDPELNEFDCADSLELDEEDGFLTGTAKADIHLTRTSECCGDEMKEATIEPEEEIHVEHVELTDHIEKVDDKWRWREGHEPVVENDDPEQIEEGGGRYAKSYFGASVHYSISCKCGATLHDSTLLDKIAASHMDDLT